MFLQPQNVKRIYVHCSATGPSQDIGCIEIDAMHRARKFAEIGYHVVIRRLANFYKATVEMGSRTFMEVGAHVKGANAKSVGVCMVGGVKDDGKTPEANFTLEQYKDLYNVLVFLKECYPEAEIMGHHKTDTGKACPCFDVRLFVELCINRKVPIVDFYNMYGSRTVTRIEDYIPLDQM